MIMQWFHRSNKIVRKRNAQETVAMRTGRMNGSRHARECASAGDAKSRADRCRLVCKINKRNIRVGRAWYAQALSLRSRALATCA